MAKKTVFYFVFDGLADWEASHALTGINKSNKFRIKTIALDKSPKQSMAGVTILPDVDFIPWVDLHDIDASNTAMLILPGGTGWRDNANDGIADLVLHGIRQQIPVAAIGDAAAFLAELQLLDYVGHTCNDNAYLPSASPRYAGEDRYRMKHAISDHGIITANGTAAIDFAREIFETLKIYDHENVQQWFHYFEPAAGLNR